MKTRSDIRSFIEILFYYFIKRAPDSNELDAHIANFYSLHKCDFMKVHNIFNSCPERNTNRNRPYESFFNFDEMEETRRSVYLRMLFFVINSYEPTEEEVGEIINTFISYEQTSLESVTIHYNSLVTVTPSISTKLYAIYATLANANLFLSMRTIIDFYNDTNGGNRSIEVTTKHFIKLQNSEYPIYKLNDDMELQQVVEPVYGEWVTISTPIYHMVFDSSAGHVLAYFIEFMKHFESTYYTIGVTRQYYAKNRHVCEFYELLRGRIIIFEKDTYYKINLLPHHHNFVAKTNRDRHFGTEQYAGILKMEINPILNTSLNIKEYRWNSSDYFTGSGYEYIKKCLEIALRRHQGEPTISNLYLVKNADVSSFNHTPYRGFSFDKTMVESNGYRVVDPMDYSLSQLIYLCHHATNVITSWNTIMYINKFWFNANSTVCVLCHVGYAHEYSIVAYHRNIYHALCRKLFFVYDVGTSQIDGEFIKKILELME